MTGGTYSNSTKVFQADRRRLGGLSSSFLPLCRFIDGRDYRCVFGGRNKGQRQAMRVVAGEEDVGDVGDLEMRLGWMSGCGCLKSERRTTKHSRQFSSQEQLASKLT